MKNLRVARELFKRIIFPIDVRESSGRGPPTIKGGLIRLSSKYFLFLALDFHLIIFSCLNVISFPVASPLHN